MPDLFWTGLVITVSCALWGASIIARALTTTPQEPSRTPNIDDILRLLDDLTDDSIDFTDVVFAKAVLKDCLKDCRTLLRHYRARDEAELLNHQHNSEESAPVNTLSRVIADNINYAITDSLPRVANDEDKIALLTSIGNHADDLMSQIVQRQIVRRAGQAANVAKT